MPRTVLQAMAAVLCGLLTTAVVAFAAVVASVVAQGGLECDPDCRGIGSVVGLGGLALALFAGAAVGRAMWPRPQDDGAPHEGGAPGPP